MQKDHEGIVSKRQKDSDVEKKSNSNNPSNVGNKAKAHTLRGIAEEKMISIKQYIPPIASCAVDLIKNKKMPGIASYADFIKAVEGCNLDPDVTIQIVNNIGLGMSLINAYYYSLGSIINKVASYDQIGSLNAVLGSSGESLNKYCVVVDNLSPADKAKVYSAKINDVFLALFDMIMAVQYYDSIYFPADGIPYGQDIVDPHPDH